MEKTITNYLANIELKQGQYFMNMAVFPVCTSMNGSLQYPTLKEALDKGLLTITGISRARDAE